MSLDTIIAAAPAPAVLEQAADRMLAIMQAYDLESDEDYAVLNDEVRVCATKARDLEAQRLSITRPMDEAKSRIMELFRKPLERLLAAKKIGDSKLIAYHDEKERQRREAQRILDEKAAAARKRLQDEADKLAAKSEALEAKAEATGDTGMLARAESAQHQAAVLGDAASLVVSQMADVGLVKAAGTSVVTRYGYELLDMMELAKAVVAGTLPLAAILPNETWLGNRARSDKDEFNVPGCRLTKSKTASHRGLR